MLTKTHKKNSTGQHSELFYWTCYRQFKSKMNLPLKKVRKIPHGALFSELSPLRLVAKTISINEQLQGLQFTKCLCQFTPVSQFTPFYGSQKCDI